MLYGVMEMATLKRPASIYFVVNLIVLAALAALGGCRSETIHIPSGPPVWNSTTAKPLSMQISTYPCASGTAVDTYIKVYTTPTDPLGAPVAQDDDNGPGLFSSLTTELYPGSKAYIYVDNLRWDDAGCYGLFVSSNVDKYPPPNTSLLELSDNTGDTFSTWQAAADIAIDTDTVHYDDNLTGDWFFFTVPGELGALDIAAAGDFTMVGYSTQFTSLYTGVDGKISDVSGEVEWVSSNPFVAAFSTDPNRKGLLEAVQSGSVTVTANYLNGSLHSNQLSHQVVEVTTPGDLVITEAGESNWIEIYNRGATPANLGKYTLKTPAKKYDISGATSLSSPPITLSGTSGLIEEVKFCYEKDSYLAAGSDKVWVDNISIQGANPALYDFQDGLLPNDFISDANGNNWLLESDGSNYTITNPAVNNDSVSCFSLLLDGASSLTYSYTVDTETSYDYLRVYVDDTLEHEWSGFSGSWRFNDGPYNLPGQAGGDTIKFCYEKDDTSLWGGNTVFLDNISISGTVGGNLNPVYDFEAGLYPADFTPDPGGINWSAGYEAGDGSRRTFVSGLAAPLSPSCFTITVEGGGSFTFDYMTRTQWGHNLMVYVNGVYVRGAYGGGYSYITEAAGVEMTLPDLTIPPGAFAVIHTAAQSRSSTSNVYTSNGEVYLRDPNGYYPDNGINGFAEILLNGSTVDFVAFGAGQTSPVDIAHWSGAAAPSPPVGGSIARDAALNDTNTSADWGQKATPTPNGPNDVNCTTDADGDLIPDCSEAPGTTFMGLPLYDWGARVGQKDIFIEVDYMGDFFDGPIPHIETLHWIKAKFETKGFVVHLDAGDLFDATPGLNPAAYDMGGGGSVPYFQYISCGESGEADISTDPAYQVSNLRYYRDNYMEPARASFFIYMLYADDSPPYFSFGGLACGRYFTIALGNTGHTENYKTQLNVFFHELGHTLGLGHGGHEYTNYKPNYISTMNYLYIYTSLPEMGNPSEGYYYYRNSGCDLTGLTSGVLDYDFSSGLNVAIDENNIDESAGLSGSTWVDFDCNGVVNSGYSMDLNSDGALTLLEDSDDWGNILGKFTNRAQATDGDYKYAINTDEIIYYEEPPHMLKERLIREGKIK